MNDDKRLRALFARWETARAEGQPIAPEDLCGDDPELLEALRERIAEVATAPKTIREPETQHQQSVPDFPLLDGLPRAIGRFRIRSLLGEGGFARVYLAEDPSLNNRLVALKVLKRVGAASDSLRREAGLAANLEHPHIIRIYSLEMSAEPDADPSEPNACVVMQYVEGRTLADRIEAAHQKGTKLGLDLAMRIFLNVVEAVAFAHSRNLLHRDLKPRNILLDSEDRPYVADFGLAAHEDTIGQQSVRIVGTPGYMSPEQARGQEATPACDVWSLGVILYELLMGKRPHYEEGELSNDLDSTIPPELAAICRKCLAEDLSERYSTVQELLEDLRRWQTGRGINPDELDLQKAEEHYQQAFAALDSGDLAVATERLGATIRLNPDHAQARYLLGLAHLMNDGSIPEILEVLRRAVELNPEHGRAAFVLACTLFELEAYSQAAHFAGLALSTEPANKDYRELRDKARAKTGSSSSGSERESFTRALEPPRRRYLSELAQSLFQREKTHRLRLTHWTADYLPWSLVRRRPLLHSALLCLGCYLILVWPYMSFGWNGNRALRFATPWVLIFLGFYAPHVITRWMERLYVRLLPTVRMPEDTFRRFFVRQSAYLLGGTASVGIRSDESAERSRIRNGLHLRISLVVLPLFLLLHYFCAEAELHAEPAAVVVVLFTGALEVYSLIWMYPCAYFSLFFIPRFYHIPIRYFLGMPSELSLAWVGSLFIRIGWLAAAGYLIFLAQHYLFDTYSHVPSISIAYVLIGITVMVLVVLLTQLQLHTLLRRLKARTILEYSYHVEAAFERVMKRPTEKAFQELRAHQSFMGELNKLSTKGLTRSDLWHFLLILAIVLASTALYVYLILNGIRLHG